MALPLVFMALAISMRVAPEEWAGPEDKKKTSSLKLYWDCKSSLQAEADVQPRQRLSSLPQSRRSISSLSRPTSWYVTRVGYSLTTDWTVFDSDARQATRGRMGPVQSGSHHRSGYRTTPRWDSFGIGPGGHGV